MAGDAAASVDEPFEVLDRWTARKIQPVVLAYLVAVFAGFIGLAHFVFHSVEAVKGLLLAAVGCFGATIPGVLERIEYRLTGSGIDKRSLRKKDPGEFEEVFRWPDLDRVKRMKHGFKFFKVIPESSALRRLWNVHISDRYSGEVHAEPADLERILGLVAERSLPIS